MTLEDTLSELERRRLGFKDRAAKIKEEMRQRELALLADERAQIEDLIAKAMASGATLGQVKRAYGTKDHRTIRDIVAKREAEIQYWRDELAKPTNGEWFTIAGIDVETGRHVVFIDSVTFDVVPLDNGGIMLSTDTPQWNEDFTVENETVREFDGKTEEESERVREIADAIRSQA